MCLCFYTIHPDERRRLPPVPTRVPSVEVISPDDVTSSLEDLNAGHRRASEHRNSSTSTSSLQSNQWDKDTASIASMDSMISTPSPTVHMKDSINPFDFEDESSVCVEVDIPLGSGVVDSPRRASHGSPETQQKSGTKPIPSPRLSRPGIRTVHTFQDPLPYHVAYVNPKTKTVLIKSSELGGPLDDPGSPKYAEPSLRPRSPHPQPPPPPESKHPSISLPLPVRAKSPTIGIPTISSDVHSSMSLDRREISLLRHLSSPSNLGQVEDDHSGLDSASRPSARDTWPGQLGRQTSVPGPDRTYMNTQEGTDRVDLSTEPCGQTTYMNLPEEHSHYQNPPLDPTKSSLCIVDKVGPKLPPRSQPPQLPPRNKKYKLYELVDLAKSGKLVVGNLIQSFDAFKRFCLFFDVKKDSFPPKDWRALAERVGLTVQDIQVIDDVCQRSSSATEIVLAYWECHTPDNMPYTLNQLVRELDRMDRQDLVEIVVQGDKLL
ncbi:uncharacterized protein [Diadema antillarum]|uniref:uncharacterized protein n=1 Tax=Diadema antillarum TaxID=105358 RepID=UPI003A8B87DB